MENSELSTSEVAAQIAAFESGQADPPKETEAEEPEEGTSEAAATEGEEAAEAEGSEEATAEQESPSAQTFKIRTPAGDEEVTLDELISRAQKGTDYTLKTMALAEERRAVEREKAEALQHAQALQQHAQLLMQQLQTQDDPAVWDRLRQEDPAEYIRRVELRRWQEQQAQSAMAQAQAAQRAAFEAQRPRERAALAEKIPEWNDEQTFRTGYSELGRWLVKGGWVDPEVWANTIDHRLITLAEYGRRYLEQTSKAPGIAAKKVAPLPKVIRPGTKIDPASAKSDRRRALDNRLTKSGDVKDAAALLAALGH